MTTKPEQRRTVTIRGEITTTAHVHQTAPDSKTEGLTNQIKTSVAVRTGGARLLVPNVPCVTANSVRALIRRACGAVLMEELYRAQNKISRNMFLSVMRGSFARQGIEAGGAPYLRLLAAQDHLFAGLWGGGAYMYGSKVRMERDLLPMLDCLKNIFPARQQADCLVATPEQIMGRTIIASRDDFQRVPEFDVVENIEQAYEEHMGAKFAANLAKRDQKATARAEGTFVKENEKLKTSDLNTYGQIETIIPGVPLYFGISLEDVTDQQIGLFLVGLQSWANRNALGGGSVRGRGSFTASLQMYEGDKTLAEHVLVGEAPNYKLATSVDDLVEAMRKELTSGALPETLDGIYPTAIAEKKPAKGKKDEVAIEAAGE